MHTYIFGYGSLMNPKSLQKTLPGDREVIRARVSGFQRKMNAPVNGYAYLNLIEREGSSVEGVLIPISETELDIISEREIGYVRTDITALLNVKIEGRALAFVAPDTVCTLKVPRSYIMTCTMGMTEDERSRWISETLIEGTIEEDLEKPVYMNAVLD